jgi:predicted cupin superfamily sugar epimerase
MFDQQVGTGLSKQAGEWVRNFGLIPHPEGGFFSEVYRAEGRIPAGILPVHAGERAFMSSIYFMLPPGDVSRFHRLKSDEIWYHHAGGRLSIHQIDHEGRHGVFKLGRNFAAGERLQVVIKAGNWFGAVADAGEEALVGCAVAPGFDYSDFELAKCHELLEAYPALEKLICQLT